LRLSGQGDNEERTSAVLASSSAWYIALVAGSRLTRPSAFAPTYPHAAAIARLHSRGNM
jgi:hypothetical protein